jgi:hypothetical protein
MSYAPSTGFVPDSDDGRKFYVAKPDQQTIVYYRDLFGCDYLRNPQTVPLIPTMSTNPSTRPRNPKTPTVFYCWAIPDRGDMANYPFRDRFSSSAYKTHDYPQSVKYLQTNRTGAELPGRAG